MKIIRCYSVCAHLEKVPSKYPCAAFTPVAICMEEPYQSLGKKPLWGAECFESKEFDSGGLIVCFDRCGVTIAGG